MTAVDVRVVIPHEDLGPDDTYHEWITQGQRVKADSRGWPNPRMYSARWTKWVCNNTDCAAFAFVSDDAIRHLLDGAEGPGGAQ
jgi:hypothetical protein